MTRFIAVSNRRGGVGKTTTTMMLAYGLSVVGRQRVLVVDLDAQSSTSMVLMGYDRLKEARSRSDLNGNIGCTVPNLLIEMFGDDTVEISNYIATRVGDVLLPGGEKPHLDIIPCSYELDDREIEMIVARSSAHATISGVFEHVQRRVGQIIRSVDGAYDYVVIDCAPGLSQIVWGVLRTADFVIIPYIPDKTAEDNVGWLVNRLGAASRAKKRTLPNRASSANQGIIDIIRKKYGGFEVQIPTSLPLSNALDFRFQPTSLSAKFGSANVHVKQLFEAALKWVND
jgi:cellulose biosynthesis protein BcsQ